MDLLQGRFLLIFSIGVSLVLSIASSETVRKSPFVCFKDICNRNTLEQYCDLRLEHCKACNDVLHDCFTGQMQENCTDFCHDIKAKEKMEELRVQDCPALSGFGHGNYNATGPVHHGDIVGVNCHSGYRRSGSSSLKCSDFGSWNGVLASCKEITCGDLLPALWWVYNVTGPARPGTKAKMKCENSNDSVFGPALICSQNGTWEQEKKTGSNQNTIDKTTFILLCTQKGDSKKELQLWLAITLCISSFILGIAVEFGFGILKLRLQRTFLNQSLDSLDTDTTEAQEPLMDAKNPRTDRNTNDQKESSNGTVGGQMKPFINNVTIHYSQPLNQEIHTHVNQSHPADGVDDSLVDNTQRRDYRDEGQPITHEDPLPTPETNSQEGEETQPKFQQPTNTQHGNGPPLFGLTVNPIGSDIAQPESFVAQHSSSSNLTANQRGGVHSQPSSDNGDLRAAKILPSCSTQPIHKDDI
ncbi:uncharacterized protein LOC128207264 [Mya arenaria]|uniref:uncharacterized protein LOC128207264 n=1 Tax=Mya arenaria TaxID=6604 RepID=UPI0022E44DBA|nr:uncharacterized protein LOC128207264 [Mya arenaria]